MVTVSKLVLHFAILFERASNFFIMLPLLLYIVYLYLAQKPDTDRCNCSICDRLGFYADIRITTSLSLHNFINIVILNVKM